jgi:DNA polymerase-3 subunit epsilon
LGLIVNIFDCETTGKLGPEARIIELSMRLCDYETQREVENLLLRFNPERNIEAKAVTIHHITNEDVKKEKPFKEHLKQVEAVLKKTDVLIAHNLIGFDLPMLQIEFERHGVTLPEFKTFDTMVEGTFCTELGKSPSLSELCFALGIVWDSDSAHSGDYDTKVLRDAFFNGVRFGWFDLK